MNKQRSSRLITIMNNVGIIEKEQNDLSNEQSPRQSVPIATAEDKNLMINHHEYDLRQKLKEKTYCEENNSELNQDFSPVVSEYFPSPERFQNLQLNKSSSSIGGDSDYLKKASQNIVKTPSTISNISLELNSVDFIASPTVIYETQQFLGSPKALCNFSFNLTPTLRHECIGRSNKKSKRCLNQIFLNEPQPSTSSSHLDIFHVQEQDLTSFLEHDDLNDTLRAKNTFNSLPSDDTIVGNTSIDRPDDHSPAHPSFAAQRKACHSLIYQSPTRQRLERHISVRPDSGHKSPVCQNSSDQSPLCQSPVCENPDHESPDRQSSTCHSPVHEILGQQGLENHRPGHRSFANQDLNCINNDYKTQKILTRKRKRNDSTNQDTTNKNLKNSGESYIGCRSKKIFDKKKIKPSCQCTKKCGEKITQDQRENIMGEYYKLANHERQWQYIVNHTLVQGIKRTTLERIRNRTQTIKYFFIIDTEKITVCKTFFINTLSISHQTVYTALEKVKSDESLIDQRGRHDSRPRRMPIETEENIINHIKLYPTVEAHYVRKNSTRKYLSELLNISKMYRLYKSWFEQGSFDFPIGTKRQYEIIFNTRFNYSFFRPKKDLCSKCTRYKEADPVTQNEMQEKYDKHQSNKERVRQIKKEDKKSADAETTVAIFDLEKVLNIPQSEVGSFHYKRKYPVYNFTIYNSIQRKGYCYVWHAQIAKRGANEVGSCIWQFLCNEKKKGIKNISFYSDGCCGQNKNRFIFSLYMFAAKKLELNITHRFFETGHGQSEADSMHSNIERELKNRVIYTPDQIYAVIMNAKVNGEKYNIKEMTQKEFYNIKELINHKNWVKNVEGEKVKWTQIMEVSASCLQPSILKYKYDFDAEYSKIETEPAQKTRSKRGVRQIAGSLASSNAASELQVLYTEPLSVSKALYDDLISLCKSGDIPGYYHCFYESLTHVNSSSEVNDGYEEENDED